MQKSEIHRPSVNWAKLFSKITTEGSERTTSTRESSLLHCWCGAQIGFSASASSMGSGRAPLVVGLHRAWRPPRWRTAFRSHAVDNSFTLFVSLDLSLPVVWIALSAISCLQIFARSSSFLTSSLVPLPIRRSILVPGDFPPSPLYCTRFRSHVGR